MAEYDSSRHRKAGYKKGSSYVDDKSRRQRNVASRRKAHKSALLTHKRQRRDDFDVPADMECTDVTVLVDQVMLSGDIEPLIALRRFLSQTNVNLDPIIDSSLADRLVDCLLGFDSEQQHEAAWCLTNLASGSHQHTEMVLPAAPHLIALISSSNMDLACQATWGVANIAGDCISCRDAITKMGAITPLVHALGAEDPALVSTASFALANICRGQDAPVATVVAEGALATVMRQLEHAVPDVAADLLNFAYFLASSRDACVRLVQSGMADALATFLPSSPMHVKLPALRVVGQLASGDDDVTSEVLSHEGIVKELIALLGTIHRGIKKETLWILSNFASGAAQNSRVLVDAGALPPLVTTLHGMTLALVKEAAFCINNICDAHFDALESLVDDGCVLPRMLSLLGSDDAEARAVALAFLEIVMERLQGGVAAVDECEGESSLRSVVHNDLDSEVRDHAASLLASYFLDDEC